MQRFCICFSSLLYAGAQPKQNKPNGSIYYCQLCSELKFDVDYVEPAFRSRKLLRITKNFKINIHICAQSCAWKELTNSKKAERLFSPLGSQKPFNFDPITLDIICSIRVGQCFLCRIEWFRYHVEGFTLFTL